MKIPKIIHQTYYDKASLSLELNNNIKHLKKINKDWEYRFYDNKDIINFISLNYEIEVLNKVNLINPKYGVVLADLFRYLLLYKVGGVYLDIKSSVQKPLDEIIKDDDVYLISQWKNKIGEKFEGYGILPLLKKIPGGEFQQWFIVSEPNHPFLLSVIKNVLFNIENYSIQTFGVGHFGVMLTSGPVIYTLAIAPLLKKNNYRIIDSEDSGLVYSIYGNGNGHLKLFKQNYRESQEPIIMISPTRQ